MTEQETKRPDQTEGEVFDPRNVRHLDGLLRTAGLSRTEAKVLLARRFEACRATTHRRLSSTDVK
jgi:hypothetical protein